MCVNFKIVMHNYTCTSTYMYRSPKGTFLKFCKQENGGNEMHNSVQEGTVSRQ